MVLFLFVCFCFTGKGDLFGSDLAHLDDEQDTIAKSTSDVRSLTYCDLQCLSLSGLKQTLRTYPELADQCATDLLHDLTYNLREGFTDPDDDTTVIPAVTLQLSDSSTPTINVNIKLSLACLSVAIKLLFLCFSVQILLHAVEAVCGIEKQNMQ